MPINCRVCESICYKDNLLSYSNMPSSAQGFLTIEDLKSDAGSDLFIVGKEGAIGNYGNASSRSQFVDRINVKFLEQMYAALARE